MPYIYTIEVSKPGVVFDAPQDLFTALRVDRETCHEWCKIKPLLDVAKDEQKYTVTREFVDGKMLLHFEWVDEETRNSTLSQIDTNMVHQEQQAAGWLFVTV